MSIEDYEPVASRLARFWEKHPEGRVITKLLTFEGDRVIVQADIYVDREDDRPVATDFAEEIRGSNNVNKTSHIENAATSAIGRAISNGPLGHTGERASSTEMEKVNRVNSTSAPDSFGGATPKQIAFLKSLARGKAWDDFQLLEFIHKTLGVDDVVVETLSSGQCRVLIDRMKA